MDSSNTTLGSKSNSKQEPPSVSTPPAQATSTQPQQSASKQQPQQEPKLNNNPHLLVTSTCKDCSTYNSESDMRFHLITLSTGQSKVIGSHNIYLVNVIKGTLEAERAAETSRKVQQDHFIVVAKYDKITITALEPVEIVLLEALYPLFLCNKSPYYFNRVRELVDIQESYSFVFAEIRPPILTLIHQISFYIRDGILCNHFTRAVTVQLLLLYRYYYTDAELVKLFYTAFTEEMEFYVRTVSVASKAGSVKELAALSGYSLSTFKNRFKECFDTSPKEWLIDRKTRGLKARLLDRSKPLKVVAEEFGFSDPSHLNIFCKKYLGGTATEVREGLL